MTSTDDGYPLHILNAESPSSVGTLEYPISGGQPLPRGYKAKFWTDHASFVVCAIFRVEKVVKNGSGKVKFVKLSNQPIAFGVSEVNLDSGDKFDFIDGKHVPNLGKHIAKQRAINAIPVSRGAEAIVTPPAREEL